MDLSYTVTGIIAWWIPGSTAFDTLFIGGQSYHGYYPQDHPSNGSSSSYYQRPALPLI